MNKQAFEGQLHYFKMVTGMTRRLVDQFPADKINYRPTDTVRTAAEIVAHHYAFIESAVKTVLEGKFVEIAEPKFADKATMLKYMDEQIAKLYSLWPNVTDAQLEASIDAWGTKMSGWQFIGFMYDEHWHHRGQLTVYLRMLGIQPVMIYDYEG